MYGTASVMRMDFITVLPYRRKSVIPTARAAHSGETAQFLQPVMQEPCRHTVTGEGIMTKY